MKISAHDFEHIGVLTLSGEFTADDISGFERAATERRAKSARHLLLNVEHLEFIDSAALESCLRLQRSLGESGGQLRLISPDTTVSTILALTRLELALESHPTVEHAVRSLR
ncbi:MAG: STAS domain-containing protein [Phycisphaerales bacterium]|nr:STAS domain-containing protein [Phycisphaerales bacterium]